ncbi:MAG: preprotein translocase subunit YajC [bacterium]
MDLLLSVVMLQSSGQGGGLGSFLIPMVLIFGIMYFLIFRPQAKKQKQLQAMIRDLKKGDKVVTAGGIYGTIAGVKEKEKTFILKIDDNVKIEITQSSVARKQG